MILENLELIKTAIEYKIPIEVERDGEWLLLRYTGEDKFATSTGEVLSVQEFINANIREHIEVPSATADDDSLKLGDFVVCQGARYYGEERRSVNDLDSIGYGSLYQVVGFNEQKDRIRLLFRGLNHCIPGYHNASDFRRVDVELKSDCAMIWNVPKRFENEDIVKCVSTDHQVEGQPKLKKGGRYKILCNDRRNTSSGWRASMPWVQVQELFGERRTIDFLQEFNFNKIEAKTKAKGSSASTS